MSNYKKKHSSNDVSLAASAILFRKLCRLFHSIFGRDGRGSKSGRRPIEHTGIVIPIPAALPLAQTNRLLVLVDRKAGSPQSFASISASTPHPPPPIINLPDNKIPALSKIEASADHKLTPFPNNKF